MADYIEILLLLIVLWKVWKVRSTHKLMSALSDVVKKISDDVGEIQVAVQRVLDLLKQTNPDVLAAVAALENADAAFDAIRDSLNAAGAEPPIEG